MSAEGHISRGEAAVLVQLAKETPPGTSIVEIGTYRGRSAIALAIGSRLGPRVRVYAVDPHVPFYGLLGGSFGLSDQTALYDNLTRANVGDVVSVVCLPSLNAAKGWSERNIGLLWIDGDHREPAVCADYEAWSPFVIRDGMVAFHDSNLPHVSRLIAKILESKRGTLLGQEQSITWLRHIGN